MSQKRIAITGCAGFIGFHLARKLGEDGHAVAGYDNFNPYYDVQMKLDRAEELARIGVSVEKGDLCDSQALESFLTKFKPTHIVNLAAQAGVRYSIDNPQAYIASNITGFVNLLEICRHRPDVPLIYASSSSVYGLNQKVPFSLEDSTDQQASVYGVTKKTNELLASTYHHLYGLPVTGLRFFTVYGPWGRPDMAYYKFTKAILNGEAIPVYNGGKMQRDFTYINDIIAGISTAIDRCEGCNVYNLGNNQPEKLEDLISAIEDALGKPAKREYLPMQAGDVVQTYADISASQLALDFAPQTSLKEGIGHFVDWFQKQTSLCHIRP